MKQLAGPHQLPDPRPAKGRGAISNRSGRFESYSREPFDDGWAQPLPSQELANPAGQQGKGKILSGKALTDWQNRSSSGAPEMEPQNSVPQTEILADSARSLITKNKSPDVPFDRSINPYRGCEHGCIYCFARPNHAHLGLSAGLDFERKIFAKHDAPDLLRAELSKRSYRPTTLALGVITDCYQPIERELQITRGLIEVLAEARHPFCIITKSSGILRDLDLLAPLAQQGLFKACVSVTTLDRKLARLLEPRAATPHRRLHTIKELSQAGIPVTVMAAPMIPALNDMELESIMTSAAAAGADQASYILLRLPLEIGPLFEEWLEQHYPDRKDRVLALIRETRGGKLNHAEFGKRMRGEGVYADLLHQRYQRCLKQLKLTRREWDLNCDLFQRPAADARQLSLL
ncbi:PA0069 family radical SAM protein [Rhodovibrionaceae bacterium A322]